MKLKNKTKHKKTTTIISTSKIIISGEYFTLNDKRSLVLSLNKYFLITLENIKKLQVIINFISLNIYIIQKITDIMVWGNKIYGKYLVFLSKHNKVEKILTCYADLLKYTIFYFIITFNINLNTGIKINIRSKKTHTSGLGSSASLIINTLLSLKNLFNIKIKKKYIYMLAKDIENFQHGFSSGIDIKACLYKKALYNKNITIFKNINNLNVQVINTGKTESTTNQSMLDISNFLKNKILKKDSSNIIKKTIVSLKDYNIIKLLTLNNKLLLKIKIIPFHIIKYQHNLKINKTNTKITGAGAFYGINGGALIKKNNNRLISFNSKKKYNYEHIQKLL